MLCHYRNCSAGGQEVPWLCCVDSVHGLWCVNHLPASLCVANASCALHADKPRPSNHNVARVGQYGCRLQSSEGYNNGAGVCAKNCFEYASNCVDVSGHDCAMQRSRENYDPCCNESSTDAIACCNRPERPSRRRAYIFSPPHRFRRRRRGGGAGEARREGPRVASRSTVLAVEFTKTQSS